MSEPKSALSASKIKAAQACSWLYWCKYGLKLPDSSNDGARRGSICHLIFEVLGNKRHKKHFTKIMSTQDIFSVESVKRLVMKHAIKEGVADDANIQMIKDMTFNGLSYDFFGENMGRPTQALSEQEFDLTIKEGDDICFRIRGFIDKLFLYKGKKFALIRDFKSSKKVFSADEVEDNLQDWIYSMAVSYLFPEYNHRQSEFLFLKFDLDDEKTNEFITQHLFDGNKIVASFDKSHINSGVVRMAPISKDELEGFKHELTSIQKYLDNFTEKDATSMLAAKQSFPSDSSFSGKLLCGFASYKGELKKDGTPKWHCPMKFDFFYYHIKDEKGNFIKTVHEEEFSESMVPKGGSYEMKYYAGCVAFR